MARVLVVEDEDDIRALLTMRVAEHGFEVVEARNGREALRELCKACAEDQLFDVMLLDISMPDVNGWRVLAAVQANPLWEEMPVIVVTGQAGSPGEITRMAQQGALYVDKGPDFLDYVAAVLDRVTG
ncbi:MAG: response regulator [Armatimonadetes bacterium]|nr:response regulator [Armatimonadota bacterium]